MTEIMYYCKMSETQFQTVLLFKTCLWQLWTFWVLETCLWQDGLYRFIPRYIPSLVWNCRPRKKLNCSKKPQWHTINISKGTVTLIREQQKHAHAVTNPMRRLRMGCVTGLRHGRSTYNVVNDTHPPAINWSPPRTRWLTHDACHNAKGCHDSWKITQYDQSTFSNRNPHLL